MTTAARALALGSILLAFAAPPAFAATPAPKPTHRVLIPAPHFPNQKLHTEFLVEVNSKGQVVRVKSGKSSKVPSFNAQTYGNVLQMWVRHPDGSAEVGLYKVTYDYNPATKKVRRAVALVKDGGSWGNAEGAATQMMDIANKEAHGQKLPPLDK
ncbi:MAG TPA: hypothetical protein VGN11_01810, partial [Candidatus Baltobacteraceae bacterium]|nr:hypothetical protein [Candidatus Baltobacteraceae bacterium]